MIPVTLSEAEIAARAQALARYSGKLIELEEEEEGIRAEYRRTMADVGRRRFEINQEIRRLTRAVTLGVEERDPQVSLFTHTERATPAEVSAIVREFRPNAERVCRVCGCTDDNCIQCVRKTGRPCHWVEEDLCSACAPAEADLVTPSPLVVAPADGFTACGRIDGGHGPECESDPDRLTFDDYLAYAKTRYQKNHASHARKMELRQDPRTDDQVRAWKAEQVRKEPGPKPARIKNAKPARPAIAR